MPPKSANSSFSKAKKDVEMSSSRGKKKEPEPEPEPEPAPVQDEAPDFSKDEVLEAHINTARYIKLDIAGFRILRINWLVSLLASAVLWALVVYCINEGEIANETFGEWQSWVTQNFTWFYIGTQNIWGVFLLWIAFSRYGNIKLGTDSEKPKYDDLTWFSMLWSCGVAIGLYYYGVTEPIYYYRGYPTLNKPYWNNDDQRAQQAMFMTLFHWGFHGWAPYIAVALAVGLCCFRRGNPLSLRWCFEPLVGRKVVMGVFGDLVDALSIACTTFGVCTSLGLGVATILSGMERLEIGGVEASNKRHQQGLVAVITVIATCSVLAGIDRGIKYLSLITFMLGNATLVMLLFFDNTWYILNVITQSVGHYIQYVVQIGWETDAWQQLNYEIDPAKTNLLMGSNGKNSLLNRVADEDVVMANTDPSTFYNQSATDFMDWWTIFYWGWWISYAPFVGLFVANISRGRTIREVVVGAFLAPTAFVCVWFGVFGSLGIKMQRVAETMLADTSDPAWDPISPACSLMGYADGVAVSENAKNLAAAGYFPLTCRNYLAHIFDIMEPYGDFTTLLQYMALAGVILYFVTSSDSGSYIDDLISASGHMNPPAVQKVYWCLTEGATAIALLNTGDASGIAALRSVSIVSGLPYTLAICFMCTSVYRVAKLEMGDEDITSAAEWKTGVFDFFHAFDNDGAAGKVLRVKSLGVGFAMPFIGLGQSINELYNNTVSAKLYALVTSIVLAGMWYFSILLILLGYSGTAANEGVTWNWLNIAQTGWVIYFFYCVAVAALRTQVRAKHGIYGSFVEDLATTLSMPNFVVSQLAYQTGSNSDEEAAPKGSHL
jgi:choline-glycine betaine transporter